MGKPWRGSVGLAAAWGACIALWAVLLPSGRPVNDDYWALGSLMDQGFWASLAWYYTDFQGNVMSWFFILLHELPWLEGVGPWASAPSIAVTLAILMGATWGSLTFLGVALPAGWRRWAILTVAATVAWLSLESVVSPNSITLIYYMPSTIVHVWPWCFALIALGLIYRIRPLSVVWLWTALLGLLAGSLGLVEAIAILGASVVLAALTWHSKASLASRPAAAWGWLLGLAVGLLVQVASPATWARGGGAGSEGALSTNIQAVERLLAQGQSILGPQIGEWALSVMSATGWARALVPVAVVGDLLLRLGLPGVIVLTGWWVTRRPSALRLSRVELRLRIIGLTLIALLGAVLYSLSGALYAYAGRHVAGLALVVTVVAAGVGLYAQPWWARHRGSLTALLAASVIVMVLLGANVAYRGLDRSQQWDIALRINQASIADGGSVSLIDVPLRAGLSQSGLRDHNGSTSYEAWVRSQQ